MKYLPKVSIVIPAYNASNYLAEAIDCAVSQTYSNIEIIVVNDGSKDDGATAAVAKKYEGQIRYFEKENGGSSSALNRGIAEMEGEWFSWLSHDDLYYPDKVQKQIDFLNELMTKGEKVEDHVIFSASELINEHGKCIYRPSQKANIAKYEAVENMTDNAFLVAEAGGRYTFHGCSCLVHKSVFEKIGVFDETLRLINDVDFWKRIYMADYRIHCLPDVLVKGRIHAKQVSVSVGYSYHNPEQDVYWQQVLAWLLSVPMPEDVRHEALYRFARTAYQKTRKEEGKRAVDAIFQKKSFFGKVALKLKIAMLRCKNAIRNVTKSVYRGLFIR